MFKATYSVLPMKSWKFGRSDGAQGSFYDSLSSLLDVSRRSFISSLRVAPPSPTSQVKRRRRNVYANLTLFVFSDFIPIYAKWCHFCEVARVSVKVIEINNNTEVNSFSIFQVNLQFSVRFQININGRHNRHSDRFLLKKRGDRSLALLDILKIFHSQLVTKWRHRYLPKTYLWLSAVLLEMSLSQKSCKLALKPSRTSLLSEKLTLKDVCSPSGSLLWK